MKRMVQVAAGIAVLALAAGGCGRDSLSTSSTSKGADLKKAQANGGGMHGAIFTTDSSGDVVNGNIYTAKEDVYLNGGPKKDGAAGLPDGTYYYLITDPGCKMQLAGPSADDPNNTSLKIINVVDGEFTELMQLAPFADTPNNGGEYKVHVTKVSDYEEGEGCFGFLPNKSKTDNYKVRGVKPPEEPDTYCISGTKCFDRNGNGVCDSQEGPVAGIAIVLSTGPEGEFEELASTTTSTIGNWAFCGLLPGDYHVSEVLPLDNFWEQTLPANDGHIDVTITDHDIENLLFANRCHLESLEGPVPADPCEIGLEMPR